MSGPGRTCPFARGIGIDGQGVNTGIELRLQRLENKSLALNPGLPDKNGGFYFEIEVGFPAFQQPGMPVVLGTRLRVRQPLARVQITGCEFCFQHPF